MSDADETITDREFAGLMTILSETLGFLLTPLAMREYYHVVSEAGYTYAHVLAAKDLCVKRCKFFPKPFELLEFLTHVRGLEMRALRDAAQPALPAKPAQDNDLCGEDGCTLTVGDHRGQFRTLVERIGRTAGGEEARLRPSYLERQGIHPLRPGVVVDEL